MFFVTAFICFQLGSIYQKRKFLFGIKDITENVMEEISGNVDGNIDTVEKVKAFEESDENGRVEKFKEILIAEGEMKMVRKMMNLFD